jgi:hypothetical protein
VALEELFANEAVELAYSTAATDTDVPAIPAHVLLGYTREEALPPNILDLVAGNISVKIAEAWRTFHLARGDAASCRGVLQRRV